MFNFTCLSFYEANMREITCCFHWEPVRSSKEKKEAKKTLYARITYHSLTCLDIPAITARDTYQTWNYRKAIKLTIFANFYLIIFNVREIKKQRVVWCIIHRELLGEMLQWSIRHKPAKHGCDDLCTLLWALTSCLTPPHPVDNCFFSFFRYPSPPLDMAADASSMAKTDKAMVKSHLFWAPICLLIGGKREKKQMRSEGTKKRRRRRDRSVSDNGLGQQNRVRLKVCKNYCSSCTSCLFSSGSWYLSHNSHFDRKLPPFNFRLFKKTFEWDISFSLISFLKNPFSCPTRLFKPSVIRWDPSSKVEAPSPPKFLKLRS